MFNYCVMCYNAEAETSHKFCKACRESKERLEKTASKSQPSQLELDKLIDGYQREEKRAQKTHSY